MKYYYENQSWRDDGSRMFTTSTSGYQRVLNSSIHYNNGHCSAVVAQKWFLCHLYI